MSSEILTKPQVEKQPSAENVPSPGVALGSEAANHLTNPAAKVPDPGSTEAARNSVDAAHGSLTLTGHTEATPAKPEATPAKPEATPAKPEATPAKPEATPAKPEATPAKPDVTVHTPGTSAEAPNDSAAKIPENAKPPVNTAFLGAHEVITDASGKETLEPLGELTAGDHTIELKDGRQFMMHVPPVSPEDASKPLPVMFAFSGSAEGKWNIKDFAQESGLNTKADSPDSKFIAVYPLPEKHLIGTGSSQAAYGWNVLDPKGGVLIDKADSANAGYDDLAYVKDIVNLLPQIANVDKTHKDWAAIGFSQGGVFLNYLASNVPNLFPTMGLVGTAIDTKYNYHVQAGDAQNVDIVNLRGDESTLPFKDNESTKYKAEAVLQAVLPKSWFEKLDGLASINNLQSDPAKQMLLYENRLGKYSTQTIDLSTPIESTTAKDKETFYKSADPNDSRHLEVVDLLTAQHSYPEADPSGKRTNATAKYTEVDIDKVIIDSWMKYDKDQGAT